MNKTNSFNNMGNGQVEPNGLTLCYNFNTCIKFVVGETTLGALHAVLVIKLERVQRRFTKKLPGLELWREIAAQEAQE